MKRFILHLREEEESSWAHILRRRGAHEVKSEGESLAWVELAWRGLSWKLGHHLCEG
jgi:hypothetical protein